MVTLPWKLFHPPRGIFLFALQTIAYPILMICALFLSFWCIIISCILATANKKGHYNTYEKCVSESVVVVPETCCSHVQCMLARKRRALRVCRVERVKVRAPSSANDGNSFWRTTSQCSENSIRRKHIEQSIEFFGNIFESSPKRCIRPLTILHLKDWNDITSASTK